MLWPLESREVQCMSQPMLYSQHVGEAPWRHRTTQGRDLRRTVLWMRHPELCDGLEYHQLVTFTIGIT